MLAISPKIGEVYANVTNVLHLDGSNSDELTIAEIETRKQVPKTINFFRKYIPGFENCCLIQTATQVGVRESRRIIGEYILTKEDVVNGVKYKDTIARGAYPIDIHGTDGGVLHIPVKDGSDYGIPYRCLIPKSLNNVLVVGRAISSDRFAFGSIRVIAQCMAIGQAGGVAAGLCVQNTIENTRNLNINLLKNKLIEQDAYI